MNVSNSTIGENSAINNGGGVKVTGGGIILTNVTLFENSVDGIGSAVVAMTGTVTIRNSIVAATNADDSPLCAGNVVAPAFVPNLASDDSCGASIVDNPMLGTLMNNGGSTLTYMLNPTSRAVDAGDDVLCNAALSTMSISAASPVCRACIVTWARLSRMPFRNTSASGSSGS